MMTWTIARCRCFDDGPRATPSVCHWTAAFALFVLIYAPMLLSRRIDGKPG